MQNLAHNLAIDPERLWGEIMETAAIGGTAKGGICRLTLTDLDRQVRDWFRARAEALGCTRHGRRHGRDVRAAARAARRYAADRDGQPSRHPADRRQVRRRARRARRARRRCARCVRPATRPTRRSRWSTGPTRKARALRRRWSRPACSRGCSTRDWARSRKDRAGDDLRRGAGRDRLSRTERCGEHPLSAFFELHIEQGPILEAEGKRHRRRHRRAGHALVRGDA